MQAKTHQLQKGFTLLEMSITTVITTMIIIGTIQMQTHQATLEAARSIGDMYRHIGKAAESYMANYYGRLRALPDACSNVAWAGSTVLNRPAGPPAVGCTITIAPPAGQQRQVVIANGLQPTLEELEQLGLMVRAGGVAFNNQLPMPTFAGLNRNPLQITDAAGRAAPAQYAVLIRRMPIAGGGLAADLSSLVFNLQPYNLTNTSRSSDVLLDHIVMAAGGDAFLSDTQPGNAGRLRGQAGSQANELPNPLQVNLNGADQGAPFVLAMRGGFGSAGFDQFVRRDGTQTLTDAWNVGGQDITGVNNLGAVNGTFTGDILARDITGRDITGRDITGRDISGRNGTLGGNLGVTGDISGRDISGRNGTLTGNLGVTGDISGRDISGRNGTLTGNLGVTGDISGRDISGRNGTLSGNLGVTGDLSANKGTFSDLLSGVSATFSGALEAASAKINGLLEAANAKIAGALEVVGNAVLGSLQVRGATTLEGSLGVTGATTLTGSLTANGTNALNGQTTAQQFRLGSEAEFGRSCDPAIETIRRASLPNTPNSVRLVVCDPDTKTWTYSVDFTGALNTLGTTLQTNITTLGSNLQANIDTLQSQVAKGDKDLLALVEKNTSDIATNTKDITTNTTNIATNASNIVKLDNRVTVLENRLTGYTDLQTLVGTLSTTVGSNTSSIAGLNTSLSQLGVTVGSLGTDVSTLKGQQIKWQLINFTWKPGDRVWKQTPWGCKGLGGATLDKAQNAYYYPNASAVQEASGNYTTPIMVGFDEIPNNDKTVYDINCINGYWYIGMSSVKANTDGGNTCRHGLAKYSDCGSIPDSTYPGLVGYNTERMAARFIALSRGSL
jgi:Tfp pilus assembly protein PilV